MKVWNKAQDEGRAVGKKETKENKERKYSNKHKIL
jgi:hypothetical protein